MLSSRSPVPAILLFLAGSCTAMPDREPSTSTPAEPLFRFGLLADVQYADKPDAGARHYRLALEHLDECVADLSGRDLAFMAQLGDLIDGRGEPGGSRIDLEQVLSRMESIGVPLVHVVGNHCLEVPRAELLPRLGLESGRQSFARDGWRFLVLDSLELSVCGVPADDPRAIEAEDWLQEHADSGQLNVQRWNGGVGADQRAWLKAELAAAEAAGERVVVFGHLPILLEASGPYYLLWDHAAVLELLQSTPAVVAYLAGHDHAGGYAQQAGIHHLTLPGMLDAPEGTNAYAVVEVWPERLEVRGVGEVTDRTLAWASSAAE